MKCMRILELKVLADVGLVGFPNAGKSTLLSVITDAKPKIADYEFTTLKPNLGIVKYRDFRTFIMADIPGIIEGASEGKGLGHYFLRHIERNSTLLFMIPSDSDDIVTSYKVLLKELKKYNFIKIFDLQNSSRTNFYKNILFPKVGKEVWSSSLTTLPSEKDKDEF